MNIHILVIPETEQRACVSGADWFWDDKGDLQVRVSPMSDWRYEVLLAVHEMIEALMCKHNGVTQAEVDRFDAEYDLVHTTDQNAGDDPNAPYRHEHCLATAIERVLCAELEVVWKLYDDELAGKYPGASKKAEG